MKVLTVLGLASVMALAAVSPANAAQGCGPGMHRGGDGACHPNHMGAGGAWVVGRYYPGHGYWYNNQWYHHRVRWHNGWRYR